MSTETKAPLTRDERGRLRLVASDLKHALEGMVDVSASLGQDRFRPALVNAILEARSSVEHVLALLSEKPTPA